MNSFDGLVFIIYTVVDRINRIYRIPKFGEIPNTKPNLSIFSSWFPSLGIPRLDLEYRRWNTYVGHLNSYLGIPMSNVSRYSNVGFFISA